MADGFLTSSDIQGEPLLNHCYRVTAVVVAVQLGRGRGEGRRRIEHTYIYNLNRTTYLKQVCTQPPGHCPHHCSFPHTSWAYTQ